MSDMPHQVAIVVLNFNSRNETVECLAQLQRLDYASASIIVVDNGSRDESVREIRARYPDVPLLENGQNLGFGAGNNVGIRYALERGADYVWLLNNDTLPPPNALFAMIKTACRASSPCIVGSVLVFAHDPATVQAWGGGTVRPLRGATKHRTGPGRLDYLTAASLLAPRSFFEQVGLFDERFFLYWEDTDICRRATRAGWNLEVAEEAIILHRHSASTKAEMKRASTFADEHFVRGMVRYFLKHARPWGYLSVAIRLVGMVLNRLRRGQTHNIRAILTAAAYAWRQPRSTLYDCTWVDRS